MVVLTQGLGVQVVRYDVMPWKVLCAGEPGVTIVESEIELAERGPLDLPVLREILQDLRDTSESSAKLGRATCEQFQKKFTWRRRANLEPALVGEAAA